MSSYPRDVGILIGNFLHHSTLWCNTKPHCSKAYLNWSHHSEIWGAQSSNNLDNAPDMVLHDLSGGQYTSGKCYHWIKYHSLLNLALEPLFASGSNVVLCGGLQSEKKML